MSLFRRAFSGQGAPPGSITQGLDQGAVPAATLTSFDQHTIEQIDLEQPTDLANKLAAGKFHWVDVTGTGDGSFFHQLGTSLELPPMGIADAIHLGQRPKIEEYDDWNFAVLRATGLDDEDRFKWEQVSLFWGPNILVTLWESATPAQSAIHDRLKAGRKNIRTQGAEYLAAAIIDSVVDGYFPVVEHYSTLLEQYEDGVLQQDTTDILSSLYLAKRDLAIFRRSVWPLREALFGVLKGTDWSIEQTTRLALRDALDHTTQVIEVLESFRELNSSLVDVHLSFLGQKTNDVMKVLTVVSTIFIPLSFLAGVYGMNFDTTHPRNLPELGWEWGYIGFWLVCLAIASALLLLFRSLGWLGRRQ